MHSKQSSRRNGERQPQLTHGHARDEAVHQISGGLGYAARAARREDAAPLATKGEQRLVRETLVVRAHEAMHEDATFDICNEPPRWLITVSLTTGLDSKFTKLTAGHSRDRLPSNE